MKGYGGLMKAAKAAKPDDDAGEEEAPASSRPTSSARAAIQEFFEAGAAKDYAGAEAALRVAMRACGSYNDKEK